MSTQESMLLVFFVDTSDANNSWLSEALQRWKLVSQTWTLAIPLPRLLDFEDFR